MAPSSQGHWQQNAGLFRIDPNLTWGNQLISNDTEGGYYRLDYQDRRWLADVGIDEVRSVSGLGRIPPSSPAIRATSCRAIGASAV